MQLWSANAAEEKSAAITENMHEYFERVSAIKAAVIAGRLEDVREPSSWVATDEELVFLPYIEEIQRYAASASSAEDLATAAAAAAVGEIARTCGECHLVNKVEVGFGYAEPPPQELQSLMTQMQRHLWAADRMWTGLVSPSDAAWKQGADILAEVQLVPSDITEDLQQQTRISDLMQRLRAVGERAGQANSIDLRSYLYGEYLSLCAACHSLTGAFPATR